MTAQDYFDTVVRHLYTQKKRAFNIANNDRCMYRTPRGLKCAVGCVIPDDKYRMSMDRGQ